MSGQTLSFERQCALPRKCLKVSGLEEKGEMKSPDFVDLSPAAAGRGEEALTSGGNVIAAGGAVNFVALGGQSLRTQTKDP